MSYNVRLEVFEGPLALLLHLIEKNQIDIYDIPIAEVTQQYLTYIKSWSEFNMEVASEFLLMAATLLQIKSRMLLPKPPQLVENEIEEDPRLELVNRLIEYRRFKQIAVFLQEIAQEREQFRTRGPQEFSLSYPILVGLDSDQLIRAFLTVWESKIAQFTVVARDEVSVQDKIADILQLLTRSNGKIEFTATFIRSGSRQEVVSAFLAILELLRLKRLIIEQQQPFGPIYLIEKEDACG
jgi:segregation and condensation protein A